MPLGIQRHLLLEGGIKNHMKNKIKTDYVILYLSYISVYKHDIQTDRFLLQKLQNLVMPTKL